MSDQTPPETGRGETTGPSDAEEAWGQPWDRPAGEEHNTGLPASMPFSDDRWAPPPPSPVASSGEQWARPAFAPPDPAAVSGPPWPVLVAVGHHVPPRMLRWPIVAGLVLLIGIVVPVLALSGSSTLSHRVWIADHIQTIDSINHDLQLLSADNPSRGGQASKWLADWDTLHTDAAAAASLPNPGGSADAPWREMINNYYNGSGEIVQGLRTGNQSLISRAERDLAAGDRAAALFNREMGVSPP